jgi:uncharacterized protein YtpQ (UPF0354 family)
MLLGVGCSQPALMSPGDFTATFAEAIRKGRPELQVVIEHDLQVKLTSADGREWRSMLNNAYERYQQTPEARDEVIGMYVSASLEMTSAVSARVERSAIVPIIKDRPWLEETRKAMLAGGAKKTPGQVYEDLNPELVILYALDSPQNIRYLTPEDLDSAQLDRSELRALACANLKRLLPKIERRGTNGSYMFTAGGNYEASLLLLDSIWNDPGLDVDGDPVVAIPARDLLFVTGSRDRKGIEKLRQLIDKASTGSVYHLTEQLFVRRNGQFEVFTPSAQQ